MVTMMSSRIQAVQRKEKMAKLDTWKGWRDDLGCTALSLSVQT